MRDRISTLGDLIQDGVGVLQERLAQLQKDTEFLTERLHEQAARLEKEDAR